MAKVNCKILTPERTVVDQDVDRVVAPGSCGEFGVEPGHVALLTPLNTGVLRTVNNDEENLYALYGGFLEVREDVVRILVDVCEHSSEIDTERAEKAKKRAEERLDRKKDDVDTDRAKRALIRSINRIKAARGS